MKGIILVLSLIAFFGCKKEKKYSVKVSDFRPELSKRLAQFKAQGQLNYSQDTILLNYFRDSCKKDELIKLLSAESPLLRILGYRTIVDRNEPDYFPILVNHLDDTAEVQWWYFDDAAGDFKISDLMIYKAARLLTRDQKDSLVDIVLRNHIYLDAAKAMMTEIRPQEKYYSIIKRQAEIKSASCHDLSLTYAVAKYHKKEDIDFIMAKLSEFSDNPYCNEHIFKAIEVFPDTAFFPLLEKYFHSVIEKIKQQGYSDLKYYCRAVAQYKSQKALKILKALTLSKTYPDDWYLPDNKEFVFKAMHAYYSPLYKGLYNQLRPQMDSLVIESLDKPEWEELPTW